FVFRELCGVVTQGLLVRRSREQPLVSGVHELSRSGREGCSPMLGRVGKRSEKLWHTPAVSQLGAVELQSLGVGLRLQQRMVSAAHQFLRSQIQEHGPVLLRSEEHTSELQS